MKKLFKFSELSFEAKQNAAKEYIKQHPKEFMKVDDAMECCEDNEKYFLYSDDGSLVFNMMK